MTVTRLYFPEGNILKRMSVTLRITYLKRLVRSLYQPITSISMVLSRIDIIKTFFFKDKISCTSEEILLQKN